MDLQLRGKRAVITGGSRGIGKAIARELAKEGVDVAICARTERPLQETADELSKATGQRIIPIVCDTMDPESIRQFVATAARDLGGIEILVNSAARVGGAPGSVETVPDAEVLRDFEEKVVGYMRVAREVVPHMKQAGWGRIVNISGGAGRSPGTAISGGVRNAGTVVLTKSMANTLGPFGINVNAIYPGGTLTEATLEQRRQQAEREGISLEALLVQQTERSLIRHLVSADDIAYVAAFLCSPLAIGITGEAIAVNGGSSSDVHF
jgi:NAD(P)-dependent dehydrogenase (short-subunit alcohol dehydrogenase family)